MYKFIYMYISMGFMSYQLDVILGISPVLVGLSLIYTKRLNGMFQFCVRQTAEMGNQVKCFMIRYFREKL